MQIIGFAGLEAHLLRLARGGATFWGALAMAITGGVRASFGTIG